MKRDASLELLQVKTVRRLKRRLARAESLLSVAHLCACGSCRERIAKFLGMDPAVDESETVTDGQ